MNARDYVIIPDDLHWPTLLEDWTHILPASYEVWMANRFGHVFIVQNDKSVHRLDLELGELEWLADSREDFRALLKESDNFNQWYMVALVNRSVEAGMLLKHGECYGFVIPPSLSGKYETSNIRPVPMSEYYYFMAKVHRETKGLAVGSPVVLKVVD